MLTQAVSTKTPLDNKICEQTKERNRTVWPGKSDPRDKASFCGDFKIIYALLHQTFIRTLSCITCDKGCWEGAAKVEKESLFS